MQDYIENSSSSNKTFSEKRDQYLKYLKDTKDMVIQYIGNERAIIDVDGYLIPNIKFDYVYDYNDKGRNQRLYLDVVLLDSKQEIIVKAYEICSLSAVEGNLNTIQFMLEDHERVTGAQMFLAYQNKEGILVVLSLPEIVEINNKRKFVSSKIVTTFSGYFQVIKQLCENGGLDNMFFFRGQPDKQYEPIPSIYRKGNIDKENMLYREAIRRNPEVFTESMSTFDNLVKMQHYELPTRLLDITTNPLVALFFACQTDFNADGEVLVYSLLRDSQIKYFDSDAVCILANLAKCKIGFDFNNEDDVDHLVYDIKKDRPAFVGDLLETNAFQKVFCVLPKMNNDRIKKQDGAFFIFGMGDTKDKPATLPDSPTIIIIKAEAKKKILGELELLRINEANLFPETDKIMHQIKLEICGK